MIHKPGGYSSLKTLQVWIPYMTQRNYVDFPVDIDVLFLECKSKITSFIIWMFDSYVRFGRSVRMTLV